MPYRQDLSQHKYAYRAKYKFSALRHDAVMRWNRVKDILSNKGLTAADLLSRLGWTQSSLSRKLNEVQRPQYKKKDCFRLDELFEIAQQIGCEPWELIEGAQNAVPISSDDYTLLAAFRALPPSRQEVLRREIINAALKEAGNADHKVNHNAPPV